MTTKRRVHKKAPKRSAKPIIQFDQESGAAEVLCPFCDPPHRLAPGQRTSCGSKLNLRVEQRLYEGVECSVCGESQGTLVKVGGGYKHDHDCAPGKRMYTTPPDPHWSARLFWPFPESLHTWVAGRFGCAVVQLKSEGEITGYAWENVRERQTKNLMRQIGGGGG